MLESQKLCEAFLEHLIDADLIDADAAVRVLDEQRRQTPPIGRLALGEGILTMKQIFEVLRIQTDSGLRFGEQAIELGYMDEEQLVALLKFQRESRPSVGGLIYDLGYARKGELQKARREFMRQLEAVLV